MQKNMNRREFLRTTLASLAAGSYVVAQAAYDSSEFQNSVSNNPDKPNIIIIYADDLGYGDVSCYGAKAVKTPNIDQLANEGIRFTSGYSAAATCTPSRYSMLTGEYAWRQPGTGIAPGDSPLLIKPGRTTLASILKKAGYSTGIVGKWHLGLGQGDIDWNGKIEPGPLELGFDYSFIIPATGDRVPCVFVEDHHVVGLDPKDPIKISYKDRIGIAPTGKDNPELLRMHPSHGHDDTIVNGISRIGFMRGGYSAWWKDEEVASDLSRKAVDYIEQNKDEKFFLYFSLHDPHVPRVPNERFEDSTNMGPRGDVIKRIDWCVKQIMDTLDKLHLTENTLVIFTSDNGPVLDDGYKDQAVELVGSHQPAGPFRGWKYSRFEGGTRVPFIARWPKKVTPGQVSDAIISQVDFPATFAKLTGQKLSKNETPDSINVLPALLGKCEDGRDHVVQQGITGALGFRQGNWKYHEPHKGPKVAWETGIKIGNSLNPQLYNLKNDPGESNNLADKYPDKVEQMHSLLQRIKQSRGSSRN